MSGRQEWLENLVLGVLLEHQHHNNGWMTAAAIGVPLGIPPEHANAVRAQLGWLVQEGLVEARWEPLAESEAEDRPQQRQHRAKPSEIVGILRRLAAASDAPRQAFVPRPRSGAADA